MKRIVLVCALSAAALAPQAYAAGLPVVYGTAEKVVQVFDLPDQEPFLAENGKYAVDVGYCYKQVQVFFLPVWNYNEHYCGYINDETYTDTTKEDFLRVSQELSLDTSWNDGKSKVPLWDRIGGKIILGGIVLFAILRALFRRRHDED